MQTIASKSPEKSTGTDDYITIIAPTINAVMQRFQESGLAAKGYSITGPVGRHQFAYVGDEAEVDLFGGVRMIAATFFRPATQS